MLPVFIIRLRVLNRLFFACHWDLSILLKIRDSTAIIPDHGYYEVICSQEAHMHYGEDYTRYDDFLNILHGALSALS
mgnify:CR=1 FL=1